MKFLVWVIHILLFVLLFVLALHNTAEVSLVLPFGMAWHSPLILIVLAFFAVSILLAILAMAPYVIQHRFAVSRLRRQVDHMKRAETVTGMPTPMVVDSPYRVPGSKV